MKSFAKTLALLGCFAAGFCATASAQDSGALLDALVKKGILSDQEAEDIRADLVRDFATTTSAGKVELASNISKFKLSGDLRLRQQFESQSTTAATAVSNERNRTRFRFRLNGDMELQKGFSTGFALETAQSADSGNQTFENGNDDYGIFLARAYVSYTTGDFTITGGKQKNPIYTTDLVWDSDINPQGLSEQYVWAAGDKTTVTFRAAQFLMDDNNEFASPTTNNTDAWMFYQQAEVKTQVGSAALKIAPGFFLYNASVLAGLTNEDAFNGTTENLKVLVLPGELSFKNVGGEGRTLAVYGDLAYNTSADDRVREAYAQPLTVDEDPLAWLIGVSYAKGTGKTTGDWKVSFDYREIGLGSIDPNINDSDFAFSNLNQTGFKFSAAYNINDFTSVNFTYITTDEKEPIPGAGPGVANLDHSNLAQIDFNVKF